MNVNNEINNDLNNKFKNGKIYIIYSLISSKVYFGSTIRTINDRFKDHINYYNGYKKGKKKYCNSTCVMFDELDFNNCKVKLIKNYPCLSRKALELEEGKFIQSSKQCYNKNVAGRSIQEYYKSKVEEIKEQKKEYYKSNVDTIKEQQKKYKELNADKIKQKNNCICGGKYTKNNKTVHYKTVKHLNYLKIEL